MKKFCGVVKDISVKVTQIITLLVKMFLSSKEHTSFDLATS